MSITARIEESIKHIRSLTALSPKVGLILGSGWGGVADEIIEGDDRATAKAIDFADILHFLPPAVGKIEGHARRLIFGRINGAEVICMQGRLHHYEGVTAQEVVYPIRVMWRLGVEVIVITNAAGGINPSFSVGDFMLVRDHINFTGQNPLTGPNEDTLGPRFPDMSEAYAAELLTLAKKVAEDMRLKTQEGVYLGVAGPNYETPAEIKMMGILGADAVGMSTVFEAIAAAHLGMRVCGISCITNLAAGISAKKLTHREVLETLKRVAPQGAALIKGIVSEISVVGA